VLSACDDCAHKGADMVSAKLANTENFTVQVLLNQGIGCLQNFYSNQNHRLLLFVQIAKKANIYI
jgi:hypothetical protein